MLLVEKDYIRGCQNSTGPELAHLCIQNEEERVDKGSYQPPRMKVRNTWMRTKLQNCLEIVVSF